MVMPLQELCAEIIQYRTKSRKDIEKISVNDQCKHIIYKKYDENERTREDEIYIYINKIIDKYEYGIILMWCIVCVGFFMISIHPILLTIYASILIGMYISETDFPPIIP
tara:strand:+ start:30 stop:359 length:330 start_codon:yes stop_codon:yes gene_type:complete